MGNNSTMQYDRDMTRQFIEALTGDKHEKVMLQYFVSENKREEAKLLRNQKLEGVIQGKYGSISHRLEKKNSAGANICIMVNEGDGKGRKAENVVKVRSLFIDLDGPPMEPAAMLLKPHIVVESSPGKYHLYWKVSDCPLDRFTPLQRAIAQQFGGDTSCTDLARVLRVPGFFHQKGEPVLTRLLEVNNHPAYSVEEIVTELGLSDAEAEMQQSLSIPSAQQEHCCSSAEASLQPLNFEVVIPATGEVIDLKTWAAMNPAFDLVGRLNEHAPSVLRGGIRGGKQHIQCPFAHEHTDSSPDLATFAANRSETYPSWDIHCMHAHCNGRDRLSFLKKMLEDGWLPYDILQSLPESKEPLKVPPKVYLPHQDIAIDPEWSALTPEETRYALHLFLFMSRTLDGRLPDDNWKLSRMLGITEEEFGKVRVTLERVGWLKGDGLHIWNDLAVRETITAGKAYNDKIAAGKKRQENAKRDKAKSAPSPSYGGSSSESTSTSTSD